MLGLRSLRQLEIPPLSAGYVGPTEAVTCIFGVGRDLLPGRHPDPGDVFPRAWRGRRGAVLVAVCREPLVHRPVRSLQRTKLLAHAIRGDA